MRYGSMVLGVAAVAAAVSPAAAAAGGRYGDALRTMLTRTATGTCPADIMADKLLAACREQMPKLKPAFAAHGPITTVAFQGAEQRDGARVETYKVGFARGAAETWHIGYLKDGKFAAAYSE